MNNTTIAIDWDFIVQTILEEKCILFIGPEVFADENDVSIEDALIRYLDVEHNEDIQSYYRDETLFLFHSRAKQTKTYYKIKSFYNQPLPFTDSILEKISRIPFHLIVCLTPDKRLSNVFNELNIRHQFQFFWKKVAPEQNLHTPTANYPMIYNMLGCIERQESMVMTHTDLFNYFESIFSGYSMPEKLKKIVKEAKNFIFLGVPFNKWYMQLLLRILHIHNDYDFVKYASNQMINEEMKTFCFEQFRIEFVPNRIHELVNELYQKFESDNLLRSTEAAPKESPVNKFLTWLAADRVEDVLSELKTFLEVSEEEESDILDDVILLTNKHNRLAKRVNQGIIDEKEAAVQSNLIRKELLDLLKELKQTYY